MYTNRKISKKELSSLEGVIPQTYIEQLRTNKFYAGIISENVGDQNLDRVIFVTYSFDGWLELVWVKHLVDAPLPHTMVSVFRYLIRIERQRYKGKLNGAFFEIHADEVDDPDTFRQALLMSGFEAKEALDNIYEVSLEQVEEKGQSFLAKAAKSMKCIPLKSADTALRETVDRMIQEDKRPVPIGLYVQWEDFSEEDSLICMKDDKPCGLLLLSHKGDYIVFECAYVTDKMALSAMIGWAYFMMQKKYGPSQKVLIPVVLEKTGVIVEKIAPEAQRGKVIEGIRFF